MVGLLIGILSVGAALAWLVGAGPARVRADLGERLGALDSRMAALETRISAVGRMLARAQGLASGLHTDLTSVKTAD